MPKSDAQRLRSLHKLRHSSRVNVVRHVGALSSLDDRTGALSRGLPLARSWNGSLLELGPLGPRHVETGLGLCFLTRELLESIGIAWSSAGTDTREVGLAELHLLPVVNDGHGFLRLSAMVVGHPDR